MTKPRIEIDGEAGAAYITLGDGQVARTISLADDINLDVTASGDPVGVEFLTLSLSDAIYVWWPLPAVPQGHEYRRRQRNRRKRHGRRSHH